MDLRLCMGIVFMKKKYLIMILGAIVSILTFASPVYASSFLPDFLNPGKMMQEAIIEFFNALASSVASAAFDLLSDYVIAITDIGKIPSIDMFMNWSKWGAGTLGTVFFLKRLLEAYRDDLTGESTPNVAEIVGSFVISMALVFATPYIILEYLIPINNQIVSAVGDLGISLNVYDDVEDFMMNDEELHFTFLFLVWGIALISFSISGAIRYVDLAILLIMGPIVATTYVNRSQVYATYWTEAVAVIFTQSIHMVLAYFVMHWAAEGTFLGICFSLAGAIVALRGPQVLRQFIYGSGAGGMVSGVSRFAAYKVMMKGAK